MFKPNLPQDKYPKFYLLQNDTLEDMYTAKYISISVMTPETTKCFYTGSKKSTDTSLTLSPSKAQRAPNSHLSSTALQLTPCSKTSKLKLLSCFTLLEFPTATRDQTQHHTSPRQITSQVVGFSDHTLKHLVNPMHYKRIFWYTCSLAPIQTQKLLTGSVPFLNKILMHDPISFCHSTWPVKFSICSYVIPSAFPMILK